MYQHLCVCSVSHQIFEALTLGQAPASDDPPAFDRYFAAGQLVHVVAELPEYFPTGHCGYADDARIEMYEQNTVK